MDYLLQINNGLNSLHQLLKFPKEEKKWHKKLIDGSNYIYIFITIIIVDVIIHLINQNFQISLIIFLIQLLLIAVIIFSKRKERLK